MRYTKFSELEGEIYISIEAPCGLTFTQSLDNVKKAYSELLGSHALSGNTEVAVRYYLSDITNQADELRRDIADTHQQSFVSIIGQPPASGAKVILCAYHIAARSLSKNFDGGALKVQHGPYTSLWHASRPDDSGPSSDQTHQTFDKLNSMLAENAANLKDNSVRTWLYIRDVDNNYMGMVKARIEVFDKAQLTKATHYIASTGIEGCSETVSDLVFMDSLSIAGMVPEQRSFLTAPNYLCPTHEYNVTFERGTTIRFGDRSHHYISGTASIDSEGNVLYLGDVVRQTKRTLENIQALLESGGAGLDDLQSVTVYLRDVGDYLHVRDIVESSLPETTSVIYVRGAVCRPQWLVEIEGIAVTPFGNTNFHPFL